MSRNPLVAYLLRTAHPGDGVSDAELLRRYAAGRDEAAFELLVRRHADAVWRTCRAVARQTADAEDAFQATFLALARKPGAVRGATAAGWLHRVAVRVATRARARLPRGRPLPADVPAPAVERPDVTAVHEEIARLPDRYRLPIVLCELEGQTHAEAAAALGWPVGTVSGRLSRARDRLRDRLMRRGVGVPAGLAALAGADAGAVSRTMVGVVVGFGTEGGAPGPAVARLAAGALLAIRVSHMKALLVTMIAAAATVGGVAWSVGQTPTPTTVPVKAAVPSPPAPQPPSEFGRLMARLAEVRPRVGHDDWAFVIRDMVRLGPDVLPELVAALDATDDHYVLRSLTYVSHRIGDRRAIPALIRVLPKACPRPHDSVFTTTTRDPGLVAFFAEKPLPPDAKAITYFANQPFWGVCKTLQQWSGTKHGEDELLPVRAEGAARHRHIQAAQFHRCAVRWAAWWEAHWKDFITDEWYATVRLPALPDAPPVRPTELPRGPNVAIRWRGDNVLQSVHEAKAEHVFVDLDTGRQAGLPEQLRAEPGRPERLDDIAAWAAVEGFDLMGTEYRTPGDDTRHFVLRGLGLTAWRLAGDCRKTLEGDLRGPTPLDRGVRSNGLLVPFNSDTGRYDPSGTGSYLFRTREDGYGALFVGVEVHETVMLFEAAALGSGNSELVKKAVHKGRRFAYTLIGEGPPAEKK